MATILIPYATSEGQTARVVDRIADRLREVGHTVDLEHVERVPADASVADYDAVVVAASIHGGRHQPAIRAFVKNEREALAARPSAFVQVSLSAAVDDPERQAEAATYLEEFFAATDWRPDRIGNFAGALRYSEYGFLMRLLVKTVAKPATGDTDTSRDYEYTDWAAVEEFTDDFAALVADRVAADDTPAPSPER